MLNTNTSSNKLSHWLERLGTFLAIPLLLFITLPLIALFLRVSPPEFFANLKQSQVLQAVGLSVSTSLITMFLTILFGTPVACLLAKKQGGTYRLIDTLIDLPVVLPPAVAGVALLMAFGRQGLIGQWLNFSGISIPFTQVAVILAQLFIAAPYYIKAATLGFSSVGTDLKEAAALDGASGWEVFRYIMVPQAWMALVSGAVMTWVRALGEFGATIIFAGNFPGRTQTMPLAIYLGFEMDINLALTLSVILISFSFLTLIVVKSILHRSITTS
jgi:molybdate transport system permease protein